MDAKRFLGSISQGEREICRISGFMQNISSVYLNKTAGKIQIVSS